MRGGEFITGLKDGLLRLGDVEEEVTDWAPLGEVGNKFLVGCDQVPVCEESEYGCVIRIFEVFCK